MSPDVMALKTYTRQLISRVGGLEAAASCCRVAKSVLASYYDRNSDATMPADVMLDLERAAGEPILSGAILRLQGYGVASIGPGAVEDLRPAMAELVRGAGATGSTFMEATLDGVVDPLEAAELRRQADALEATLARIKSALARCGA